MYNSREFKTIINKYKGKTPFFLCDKKIIKEQIDKIKFAFSGYKNFELFYAMKANYSDIVLNEIKKKKIGVAVSSLGELSKAIKLKFNNISYTAPYTPKKIIQLAKKERLELNYNNYSEFKDNPVMNSGLRINPEIGWSYKKNFCAGEKFSQFGIPYKQAISLDFSKSTRLHMHTSSDSYKINVFILGLKRLLQIANKFPNIKTINIGGGVAVPISLSEKEFNIKKYAKAIINEIQIFNKKNSRNLKIQFEPGNYIVRPSIYYICQIKAIKKRNNGIYYFTNGTKHHLQGIAEITKINFFPKSNKKTSAKIIGCTCQKSDVIYSGKNVPNLSINDFIIVPMTGAYCSVQCDNFHLIKTPRTYSLN